MTAISFAGQVAIVTGAAGSIGRAIAIELVRRGASVVVNDYGGDTFGRNGGVDRAEAVAAELRGLGGKAVANSTPVGTAEAARSIVKSALEAFGRIDILASSAGITLPGLFTQPSDDAVEAHFRANLLGPYALLREVWPVMQRQRYGRVLHTSSNAALGIGANAPYATTKAGLIGLTLDTAIEGREHDIHVNAMMPVSYSRMIEQIPDPKYVDWFRKHFPPEKVAAAAAFLLSRECDFSGRVLDVGGGRAARVAFAMNEGWFDAAITAEKMQDHLSEVLDMQAARAVDGQASAMMPYNRLFPFEAGTGLSLDIATVVGAGQRET
jgi:NAD(P)-dependent dehydrogenase (short-subunit alcohol dehydrogenase family)